MILLRLLLDILASLSACSLSLRQNQISILRGQRGEILHHVKKSVLIFSAQLPRLGDSERDELIDFPGMLLRFIGRGLDGSLIPGRIAGLCEPQRRSYDQGPCCGQTQDQIPCSM